MDFKKFYNKLRNSPDEILEIGNLKFLIVRFSSIGDIVLTTPVIRCLRKKYPDAAIHYLTKKKFASILESNPYLDKVIVLEDNLNQILHLLENEAYDHVNDLHHNLRTVRLMYSMRDIPFHSFNILNLI